LVLTSARLGAGDRRGAADHRARARIVRRPLPSQEDELLVRLVQRHGAGNWSAIGTQLPGRKGKQCRERWVNHLDPSLNHNPDWSLREDAALIAAVKEVGERWAEVARLLRAGGFPRSEGARARQWRRMYGSRLFRGSRPHSAC
jgi:myb proto-oncogene protein